MKPSKAKTMLEPIIEALQHVRQREATLDHKRKFHQGSEFFHGGLCEATAMANKIESTMQNNNRRHGTQTELDLIESFLRDGPPPPPESRATKDDLIFEIKKRDKLLHELRNIFLKQIATQFVHGKLSDD
jgi:hypothetical protein